MVIGIIGAGASGMAAAISAAQNPANTVLLFERQARVGRKLSATGNGRCNLTNLHASPDCYHGCEPSFSRSAIAAFPPEKTLKWFASLGLYTVAEESGRVYPYSDQATSVVDVLRFALQKPNISLYTAFEVDKVKKTAEGFSIEGTQRITVDRLIVACGGIAGSKLGGTLSGYQILKSLGHKCTRLRPALVQVQSDFWALPSLKGVRANCRVAITKDGAAYAESCGEIQFTELGLSGPVMFEISRDVCAEKGNWEARLDCLPDLSEEKVFAFLKNRQSLDLPAEELFTGLTHNRLGKVLVKEAGIGGHAPMHQLEDWELHNAAKTAKNLSVHLTAPLGMDSAQVTAGGIETKDFDPATMESRLVPGLFACGEVLDVDGDCGGFNLQWAWSSGRLAGLCAGDCL